MIETTGNPSTERIIMPNPVDRIAGEDILQLAGGSVTGAIFWNS
jgi:hypothetical protein